MRNLHTWHFSLMGLAKFLRPVRSHGHSTVSKISNKLSFIWVWQPWVHAGLPQIYKFPNGQKTARLHTWHLLEQDRLLDLRYLQNPQKLAHGVAHFEGNFHLRIRSRLCYQDEILPDFPVILCFFLLTFPSLHLEMSEKQISPPKPQLPFPGTGWLEPQKGGWKPCNREHYHWDSWLVKKILRSMVIIHKQSETSNCFTVSFSFCNDWCLEMSRCLGILASTICSSIWTCKIKLTSPNTMWSCGRLVPPGSTDSSLPPVYLVPESW